MSERCHPCEEQETHGNASVQRASKGFLMLLQTGEGSEALHCEGSLRRRPTTSAYKCALSTRLRVCGGQHSGLVEKLVWQGSVKCLFPSLASDGI